jgi:hypothetical protein
MLPDCFILRALTAIVAADAWRVNLARGLRWSYAHTACVAIIGLAAAAGRTPLPASVSGRNSVVECNLPKVEVVGSNPIARSIPRRVNKKPGHQMVRASCL